MNVSLWMAALVLALGSQGMPWMAQVLRLGWQAVTGALPLVTDLFKLATACRTWAALQSPPPPPKAGSGDAEDGIHRVVIRLDSSPTRVDIHTNRAHTHLTLEFVRSKKKRPGHRSK